MSNLKRLPKDTYTEVEAAALLRISVSRLHQLLDEHIFTQGTRRPPSLEFTSSDLLLLSYWNSPEDSSPARILRMPRQE